MERERDHKTPTPTPPDGNNKSANIVGAAIAILGIVLLTRNLGFPFPRNIFGWEMILIIIGIVIGINSKFEKKSSIILIAIGGLFLLRRLLDFSFSGIVIPIVAVGIGIYLMVRSRNQPLPPVPPHTPPDQYHNEFDWDKRVDTNIDIHTDQDDQTKQAKRTYTYEGENYIKVESIFGYAKKIVFSKHFLGGNMTNLFGSTEINLLQADMQQPVALDVFQLFGSTKIIVPPHWIVATTASSILSENDDRRAILTNVKDQNKCLYITGTSIFGSITIKNS